MSILFIVGISALALAAALGCIAVLFMDSGPRWTETCAPLCQIAGFVGAASLVLFAIWYGVDLIFGPFHIVRGK